jgi:hypothetical protein
MIYLGRMKPVYIPRLFAIFFIVLLVLTFLVGTTLAFTGVQAASAANPTPTVTAGPASPSATPEQETGPGAANMTGIIILGILLVAIIAIGLLWGGQTTHR